MASLNPKTIFLSVLLLLALAMVRYVLIDEEEKKATKLLNQGFVIEALIVEEKKHLKSSNKNPKYELTIRYKNVLTNKLTTKVINSCGDQLKDFNGISFNCYRRSLIQARQTVGPVCKLNRDTEFICDTTKKKNYRVPFMYIPHKSSDELLFTFDINKVLAFGENFTHH